MTTKASRSFVLAVWLVATVFAREQAGASDVCSRLADHSNDVTTPNGELYTDQGAGGRLDFTEVRFARSGDDLALLLQIDDFNEPSIAGSGAAYWIFWDAPGASARVNIVEESGSWSFDAFRTYDAVGYVIATADGTADLQVDGGVDEESGLMSVLVHDIVPPSAGDTLTNVVVGSAEGGLPGVSSYHGDHIPDRNTVTTVQLGVDCTTAPDPLRAWCREYDDASGDVRAVLVPTPGDGARVDLTRLAFIPDEADLSVLIWVVDLDGDRSVGANSSRYFLNGAVSGRAFEVEAHDIDGTWSATATLGGQSLDATVTTDPEENSIMLGFSDVLLSAAPRYLVPRAGAYEGLGVTTPLGPLFVSTGKADFADAPTDGAHFTAVDVDASCPWPGL